MIKTFYRFMVLGLVLSNSSLAFADSDSVYVEIEQQLLKHVKKLHRPIQVYHYGTRGKMPADEDTPHAFGEVMNLKDTQGEYTGPVPLHPKEAIAYFQILSGQYQSKDKWWWMAGNGLYAGIDPLQSLSYLGDPGFLLQIRVPGGTTYLDTRDIGINFHEPSGSMRSLSFVKFADYPDLQPRIAKFIRIHQIPLIAYEWNVAMARSDSHSPEYNFCNLLSDYETAFEFVDASLAPKLTFTTFTQNLGANPSAEKLSAYANLLKKFLAARWLDPSLYQENETIQAWNITQSKKMMDQLRENGFKMHRENFMKDWFVPVQENVFQEIQKFDSEAQKNVVHQLKKETFQCMPNRRLLDEFTDEEQSDFKEEGFNRQDVYDSYSKYGDLPKDLHVILKN